MNGFGLKGVFDVELFVLLCCAQALKVAKKLKAHTVSGYSNDSNPFGDSNLNEK